MAVWGFSLKAELLSNADRSTNNTHDCLSSIPSSGFARARHTQSSLLLCCFCFALFLSGCIVGGRGCIRGGHRPRDSAVLREMPSRHRRNRGSVDLLKLPSGDLSEQLELVSSLIEVLDLEEMPPEDGPQLPPELRQQLIAELMTIFDSAVTNQGSYPHAPLTAMNRFQYNNAVIDLFELNCIVFTLPERMMREHKGYFPTRRPGRWPTWSPSAADRWESRS